MKKMTSGQANIAGINAQVWAAMSLFLQFLRDPRFIQIHLEAPGFQDFNLLFNDGKKIICESKDRKQPFNYADLKKILKNVAGNQSLSKDDEILIVCRSANKNLVSDVRHGRYFEEIKNKFKKKGYSDAQVSLLQNVKFWVIPPSFNEQIIYSLFTDLVSFWLPASDIEKIVDNILVQKIYKGSAKGATYSRVDILKEINQLADDAKNNSVYYNDGLQKREDQFSNLEKALSNPKDGTWNIPKELSAFSTDYERLRFATNRLTNQKDILNLSEWDPLWQLNKVYFFTFGIFTIFENNLHTKENRDYVIGHIKKYVKQIRGFYQADFFNVNVVKLVGKIIDGPDGGQYLIRAYDIIKDLITSNEKEFFYMKENGYDHGQWEKGEICKLLQKIYHHKDADEALKQKIFNLSITAFNLIEDEGEFSHHTPPEIFAILASWLQEDFINRFKKIVKILADQYDKYYKQFGKKMAFAGWEHMGGGISFSGGYHASDRHFMGILAPAIRKYYDLNPTEGWKLIKEKCISKTNQVSKTRPDFLNRAVYEIVLERYAQDNKTIAAEAFSILSELILSRKGIPHKSDLIYQTVRGMAISDDKKWKLVELTAKKYGVPVNPFAEQIIAGLAKKGHVEARAELKRWFAEPKYYHRFMFGEDAVSTIKALLDSDLNFAVELFQALLDSYYFKNGKSDSLSPFTVAALLQVILSKDYAKGLGLLRFLESQEVLTKDQQSIYCFSLFNNHGNDDSDDIELLMKVYKDVIDPLLIKFDDTEKIVKRFPNDGARAALVQFAVRLAVKKKMTEALRIIKSFVSDPDPYLTDKDPNDPKNEYNEQKRIEEGKEPNNITSVRGWCGWALMKCSVLEGREKIPEIISLASKLAEDRNYYAVHMATFALAQLAKNRLTVLPDNKEVLFFNDDKTKALKMAKQIEGIAFKLLEQLLSWPEKVQIAMSKSVLHVFDPIRSLNEQDALHLIEDLAKLPKETVAESAPLFIYFAEFRKDAYPDWKFSAPGLYDDLGPDKYNEKKFKKILIETVHRLQKNDPNSCFRFAASVEHLTREPGDGGIKKYTDLALEYFDFLTDAYGHNIYNLIYMTIEAKLQKPDDYLDQWFNLLIKCFKIEGEFYRKEIKAGNAAKVYWYPTLYHSRIVELVNERFDKEKFMEIAKIFFNFPKELDLNESDGLISLLREFAKTDPEAKTILQNLLKKSPSKYWYLRDELK
ncbi:MAG: hypothetical protein KGI69_00975 [Patescibacteria group bacterium]|nr:hypothetical protein [Patescibacteria group bacterium]